MDEMARKWGAWNALNLTDQGSVVVLTTNKQLRFGTNLHNFGAIKHQFFLNCLGAAPLGLFCAGLAAGILAMSSSGLGNRSLTTLEIVYRH